MSEKLTRQQTKFIEYIHARVLSLNAPPSSAKKQFAGEELLAVARRVPDLSEIIDLLRDVRDYLDSHGNGWDEIKLLDRVRAALSEQFP